MLGKRCTAWHRMARGLEVAAVARDGVAAALVAGRERTLFV